MSISHVAGALFPMTGRSLGRIEVRETVRIKTLRVLSEANPVLASQQRSINLSFDDSGPSSYRLALPRESALSLALTLSASEINGDVIETAFALPSSFGALYDSRILVSTASPLVGAALDVTSNDPLPDTATFGLTSDATLVGTYGSATHFPNITTNAHGLIVAIHEIEIPPVRSATVAFADGAEILASGTFALDSATASAVQFDLATTFAAPPPGPTGSASTVPVLGLSTKGTLLSLSSVALPALHDQNVTVSFDAHDGPVQQLRFATDSGLLQSSVFSLAAPAAAAPPANPGGFQTYDVDAHGRVTGAATQALVFPGDAKITAVAVGDIEGGPHTFSLDSASAHQLDFKLGEIGTNAMPIERLPVWTSSPTSEISDDVIVAWSEAGVQGGIPIKAVTKTLTTADDVQAEVDALAAAGGGVLLLSAGTYIFSSRLDMRSLVVVRGESRDSVTLDFSALRQVWVNSNSFGEMINFEQCTLAGIERLTVSYSPYGLEPFDMFYNEGPRVGNVSMFQNYETTNGVTDTLVSAVAFDSTCSHCWARGCKIYQAGANPIEFFGTHCTVSDCIIDRAFNRGSLVGGIAFKGSSNLLINCTVTRIREIFFKDTNFYNVVSNCNIFVHVIQANGYDNLVERCSIVTPRYSSATGPPATVYGDNGHTYDQIRVFFHLNTYDKRDGDVWDKADGLEDPASVVIVFEYPTGLVKMIVTGYEVPSTGVLWNARRRARVSLSPTGRILDASYNISPIKNAHDSPGWMTHEGQQPFHPDKADQNHYIGPRATRVTHSADPICFLSANRYINFLRAGVYEMTVCMNLKTDDSSDAASENSTGSYSFRVVRHDSGETIHEFKLGESRILYSRFVGGHKGEMPVLVKCVFTAAPGDRIEQIQNHPTHANHGEIEMQRYHMRIIRIGSLGHW